MEGPKHRVEGVDYDPQWPHSFEAERAKLAAFHGQPRKLLRVQGREYLVGPCSLREARYLARRMAPRVLIIGATSAVAQAYARRRKLAGARMFLVARNPDKLAAICEELGESVVGSRSADLSDTASAGSHIQAALDELGGIDEALIAHGYLGNQIRSEKDFDEAQAMLSVNLLSPIALLVPLVNHMENSGRGHLGVITSVAGERGRPRNFTYGAAKGGLSRYLEGVRSRVYGSGLTVHNFKLGPVDSPMTVDHEKNASFTTPERAAELIEKGMRSGRHEIYVPGFWRLVMLAVRWMPEPIFQRLKFLSGR